MIKHLMKLKKQRRRCIRLSYFKFKKKRGKKLSSNFQNCKHLKRKKDVKENFSTPYFLKNKKNLKKKNNRKKKNYYQKKKDKKKNI